MKAKKIKVGIINLLIFSGMVVIGAGSGYYTGLYRIGVHTGIALGIIAIILFRLIRERIDVSLKNVKI